MTISGKKLNKFIKESKTVDALMTILATRRRIRGFTDIERLKMDIGREFEMNVNEQDTEDFFRALETQGYGHVVRSRQFGGNPRFIWKYDMRSVADAAINSKDLEVDELPESMQRLSDASRKPKEKPIKEVKEVVKHDDKIEQIVLNGETYIKVDPKEYLDLKRLKALVSKLT